MSIVTNSRAGITTTELPGTGYAPIGADRFVPMRYAVTADLPALPLVHLVVSAADGRPVIDELRLERRPGGPPITSTLLRDVPLASVLRESVAIAGTVRFHGVAADDPRVAGGQELEYGSSELAAAIQDSLLTAYDARQGVPVTDDVLRKVAEVYRAAHAAGKPPTQAVAREFVVSRSTAGRYVQRARQRGFLGPTRERVAGA